MKISFGISIHSMVRIGVALLVGVATPMLSMASAMDAFHDPLVTAASTVSNLERRSFQAITEAGDRHIAVGARGLIALSNDGGRTWQQASSPVQSDLLAVQFVDDQYGWAVGHDGVVLHSRDGGQNWIKQFDGLAAAEQFIAYYKSRGAADDPGAEVALASVQANYARGPSLPLLDLWFLDREVGYAVGSFGTLIFTQDGGKTWSPGFDYIDNSESLNLNAIRAVDGTLYIAAERGTLFRQDAQSGRFHALHTGSDGSLFGITGSPHVLLAYGLNGTLFRSLDRGEQWSPVSVDTTGSFTASKILENGKGFALVTANGSLFVSDCTVRNVTRISHFKLTRLTGVTTGALGELLLSSLEGLRMHQGDISLTSTDKGAR